MGNLSRVAGPSRVTTLPNGRRQGSDAEDTLAFQLVAVGINFERQLKFHPDRQFKADFLIDGKLIVEVDGAVRGKPGAHQRVDGIDYDCERQAEALCLGYAFMRVSARMARDGRALKYIERMMEREANGSQP